MITIEDINSFFLSRLQSDVILTYEFRKQNENEVSQFCGEFDLMVDNQTFRIQATIPRNYPLGEIKFIPIGIIGYSHQNPNGELCLNTPLILEDDTYIAIPERNFTQELDRLKEWLQDYVINEKADEHYEYPAKEHSAHVQILFSEEEDSDIHSRFKRDTKFGTFKYIVVKEKTFTEHINRPFGCKKIAIRRFPYLLMAMNVGNGKSKWSDYYENKPKYNGFWFFLEKPPLAERKQQIEYWKELLKIIPLGFKDFLLSNLKNPQHPSPPDMSYVIIMLGYEIPNKIDKEVHWDLVLIPKRFLRAHSKRRNSCDFPLKEKKIEWGSSINICYSRFFGRGKLSSELTDARILVIGCGAIGSNLVLSLVRGGLKNLSILDHDIVEPGNICRAEYSLLDISEGKISKLQQQIQNISPFINVHVYDELKDNLSYICKGDNSYDEVLNLLKSHDYIFDCTADNRLCYLLDELNIGTTIINLSITNNAVEFICVTGRKKIQREKQKIFMKVLKKAEVAPSFREGTGCWHPTFNASYVDIHTLVGISLKEINNRLSKNLSIRPFIIRTDTNATNISYTIEYPV